jgi:hypothetical protein
VRCHDVRKLPAGPVLPKSPSAVLRALGGGFKSYRIVSSVSRVVFPRRRVPVSGRFKSRGDSIGSAAVAPVVFDGTRIVPWDATGSGPDVTSTGPRCNAG